ncbi:uncharacterized protein LOC113517584 [Galleria mellonella]|uniref:Uncharacterized protein LOC113517584 n=1 Tax=Galleria mellonella TaxID=7137 RepID=A0A6J1WYG3_GALME|nr:uncharacterized protein LOC113517584 [Galleria mellonella]
MGANISAAMDFDTEKFIEEIKNRPVLWDFNNIHYFNKELKIQKWAELVKIFGNENMTIEDSVKCRNILQKKWKNIRDQYIKDLKLLEKHKRGLITGRRRCYVYFDQLHFLKETVMITTKRRFVDTADDDNGSVTNQEMGLPSSSDDAPVKRLKNDKKIERNKAREVVIPNKIMEQDCDVIDERDEDRLFLLSLVKEFKKIPEERKMDVKCEIMSLIRDVQMTPVNCAVKKEEDTESIYIEENIL